MTLMINIILLAGMYPILPILYFLLKNETEAKKNIVLGVTLPPSPEHNEKTAEILRRFTREMKQWALLLSLLPFSILLIPSTSIATTIMLIWLFAAIALLYLPYIRAHRALKELKGTLEPSGDTMAVDLQATRSIAPRPSPWWFLPPILLALAPLLYEAVATQGTDRLWMLITYGSLLLIPLLCLFFSRIITRQPAEIVSEDSGRNATLTRIRRRKWHRLWLQLAWLSGVFSLFLWLYMQKAISFWFCLIAVTLYTTATIWIAIKAEMDTRDAQARLSEQEGGGLVVDNDANWIWGMFYYNKNDRHSMVNKRIGVGTTMNMAHPAGKAMAVFSLLTLLSIPALCVWIIAEEFTPLRYEIGEQQVTVRHLSLEQSIPWDDIASVESLPELPSVRKIAGTGMEHLLKGSFKVTDIGRCQLYLNPKEPPFYILRTQEKIYILNATPELAALLDTFGK